MVAQFLSRQAGLFWGVTVGTPDVEILKIRHYNVISDFPGLTHTPWTIDLTNPNTPYTRIHTCIHTRIRVTPITLCKLLCT